MSMSAQFSDHELARRRVSSRKYAWALAAAAITLYAIGFFIQR